MATQKVGEVSQSAVDARLPPEKVHNRGRVPVAAMMLAILMLSLLLNAGKVPTEICKKLPAPLATQTTNTGSPAMMNVRMSPGKADKKLVTPLAARRQAKQPWWW